MAWLAFSLVVGTSLPVFLGKIRRVGLTGGETTVHVVATLGGMPWNGRVIFKIGGTQQWAGTSVPYDVIVPPGVYTVSGIHGGPAGAVLRNIGPSASQLGTAGTITTFTLVFVSESDPAS